MVGATVESSPRPLVIRTRHTFAANAKVVWPLLCSSKMEHPNGLLFKLGVPQPLECRLPEGRGGVGSERECVSNQGVVRQRILIWEPEHRLSFRMETTNLRSARSITGIEESFLLDPAAMGVVVTRSTTVHVGGRFRFFRKIGLAVGLKQVHRTVFRNWERLADGQG